MATIGDPAATENRAADEATASTATTAAASANWPTGGFNTFKRAWQMNAVAGGTRGEPFVASLLSCACSLLLSLKNNRSWDLDKLVADESVWINGISTLVSFIYLVMFLRYADPDARRTTSRVWIPVGTFYLVLTGVFASVSETTIAQWLCTVSVGASWCIPVLLAVYVMEKNVANLPDYLSSSVGLFYSIVWFVRAYTEIDHHGLGQNVVGAFCSCMFLFLKTSWTHEEAAILGDLEEALLDEHIIGIEGQQDGHQVELAVDDPAPVLPLVLDPAPVLPVVLDPAPVLPVAIDPQQVLPLVLDPAPVLPVVLDPAPVLPLVLDPAPVLPLAIDPQQVLPLVFGPQPVLPVVFAPQPVLPVLNPAQVLPVANDPQHELPVNDPQHELPVVHPQPEAPIVEPEPEPELPVDPPPEPVDPEPGGN